ncbi:GMC family oxidoreductase N-terminal domain-containing protein [Dictyobacter formicarum]|uniref:long-chain-alcohol oxidase n=1 Tax=Dictyobacter formicarum TaxID=2778368 RepID=A0ABQ3VCK8_9CHLR|nr:GMC family oxidoreductase N-terminal domain-containing protein [Dictyobacter formicarum]GHO83885.1 GMC oxidoreductase [Dictyobacter formicarum]
MDVTSSSPQIDAQSPPTSWLSDDEFHVLEAICETFFPALDPPANCDQAQATYYRASASDLHLAPLIAETLGREDEEIRADVRRLLALLLSPTTGLLLAGTARPFSALPFKQREKYLLAMAHSPLVQLRQGYQLFKRLTGFLFYATPDSHGHNPSWEALDYQPADPPSPSAARPLQPLTIEQDSTLECDAVVIGSGAGGGVVADELARTGKNVIVLEKGGYQSEADFTLQEAQAMNDLYLKRGLLSSKDLGVAILAGSTLGGGTIVNWNTSFRTPPDILAEWEQLSGLPDVFTGSALQKSFVAVEQRIQINTANSAHNRQNQLLFEGARALGYHADSLRRNAVGCEQRCGTCGFGCRYGCKQSTLKTYLQDAYEHGARIIVHCSARRVLIEQGRAAGVEATVYDPETHTTRQLTIQARTVVVAAGAIHSPAILLRSELTNPHIGQHLHLHPTTTISGRYPEKVYPWQGVMQSAYSDEFGHLHGNYGYKLEVAPTHPGLLGMGSPWHSACEYRENMSYSAYRSTIIVLTRDKGEGKVTLDRHGELVIDYVTSVFDRRHILHGLRQAARVHMAAGANEVISLQSKRSQLTRQQLEQQGKRAWHHFDRQLERNGLGVNRLIMYSAHQMGTCRMGKDPTQSVTDAHSQVHGVQGLFVCDGSVFPAASGVNPMLSIMGLAHQAAQYIKSTV